VLARILRELLSNFGIVFMGGMPVRVACITVEHQRSGFQHFFKFFLTECNSLVVVVRTNNFDTCAVAHEPLIVGQSAAAPARSALSIPDGSASLETRWANAKIAYQSADD
jgi:hypothetical protein